MANGSVLTQDLVAISGNTASKPTTTSNSYAANAATLNSMIGSNKFIVLARAIKAWSVSPTDDSSGIFAGGLVDESPHNGTVYNDWSNITQGLKLSHGKVEKGITVRYTDTDFPKMTTADLAAYSDRLGNADEPNETKACIYASGLTTGQVIHLQSVTHIAAYADESNWFAYSPKQSLPKSMDAVRAIIATSPVVVDGHSFRSFLLRGKRVVKVGKNILNRLIDTVDDVASI